MQEYFPEHGIYQGPTGMPMPIHEIWHRQKINPASIHRKRSRYAFGWQAVHEIPKSKTTMITLPCPRNLQQSDPRSTDPEKTETWLSARSQLPVGKVRWDKVPFNCWWNLCQCFALFFFPRASELAVAPSRNLILTIHWGREFRFFFFPGVVSNRIICLTLNLFPDLPWLGMVQTKTPPWVFKSSKIQKPSYCWWKKSDYITTWDV